MDATVKKARHPDRITLDPASLQKLANWISQLNTGNPGISVTRSNLVAWLIDNHSDQLSSAEILGLEARYFDSVKYAKWAVREVIAAKARGESLNLKLTSASESTKTPASPRKRSRKATASKNANESVDSLTSSQSTSNSLVEDQTRAEGEDGCLAGS